MRNAWENTYSILFILLLKLFTPLYSVVIDNITPSQPLLPGQTLISSGQIFELGFFSPNNSSNRYVGIWYKDFAPHTVFWVANREKPVTDSSSSLKIDFDGNLNLVDGQNNSYWSTNISGSSNDSVAVLSDIGNFVLKNSITGTSFWESIQNLCDTLFPSMDLWVEVKTGHGNGLVSWQSDYDPSSGKFRAGLAPQTPPQMFIWNGSKPYWRSGQWNNLRFTGAPDLDSLDLRTLYVNGETEVLEQLFFLNTSSSYILSYMVISSKGSLKLMNWASDRGWYTKWTVPNGQCDIYGACGPNGVCQKSEPLICSCLQGFIPQSNEEWSKGNWTRGCRRRAKLLCQSSASTLRAPKGKADGFWKVSGIKLPDYSDSVKIEDVNLCHQWCMNNCSCNAYAFESGIGCMVWAGDLIDIQKLTVAGEDLFLRLAHSELAGEQLLEMLIICFSAILIATILGVVAFGLCRRRTNKRVKRKVLRKRGENPLCKANTIDTSKKSFLQHIKGSPSKEQESLELPIFEFESIRLATNNFDIAKKLGQGGFGSVYKGTLQDGKDVAIKRLSSGSGQGTEEFKNEIMLISKLQHRNLVTLIGCCIAREEKILIYEYMSNKSLDTFLFDPTKRSELDWAKRFNIIHGVAQGLLYIHRDSRLRIVHRDLKVSNILLDEKMNPRISDFGLARTFQGTQDLASTHRVVGTLGYMSPEYALGGIFSEKSDVFSFGVLLLEIISGKKNSFQDDEQHLSLISYAWKLWSDGKALDLIDEALADSFLPCEVMKCVKTALLCVQDQAADRPTMATVVSMLSSSEMFVQPKEPAFIFQFSLKNSFQKEISYMCTANEVTLSPIGGR